MYHEDEASGGNRSHDKSETRITPLRHVPAKGLSIMFMLAEGEKKRDWPD